ncbi:hypothetical protein RP20_CCG010286 [Aedes albopictus]|nr:hypothetical protein RP20_CCG010286 [Aedes albopictus]
MPSNVISSAQPQPPPPPPPQGQAQFQRLKVEDALSYLDQVKFRFGNQPQVYNDFLDIMKEFKSQSIDTPGVIQRVSNLFKGHPELIVGFNTFLPPGYKIEVQANDQGYAFQVSVSVPSTSAGTAVAPQPSPHKYNTIFQGGGQIVQTGNTAVNLVTYGHSTGSVHTTLQPVSTTGPTTQNSNVTSIPPIPQSPQNFSRDRERTISGGSGGPTMPPSNTPIGSVTSDPSALNSQQQQQNLHRMISQTVIPHQPQQQQPPPPETAAAGNAQPNQPNVKCSGRTALCRDVLNDTWVSFPTWAEDSTFVTSRKTQYEEFIYRCEDERFELDVVIETNSATIRVLEGVQKKLSRMSQDEVSRFRLDECLGGTSATIHQRALKRIYGDKAADIIQGLRKNPVVAVPVVLRRLKAKEEEWREAQKGFNKQWREQNEKYYLKSLDHQGINFKQNDIKALRSKSLFNEIETLFDERHEQTEDGSSNPLASGPHLVLPYKDKSILDDAANLLIHHVKRQTGIQKQEKARIKHILRQFVPDLFFAPRQQLSDDEREEDDRDMDVDQEHEDDNKTSSKNGNKNNGSSSSPSTRTEGGSGSGSATDKDAFASAIKEETPDSTTSSGSKPTTSVAASSSSPPESAMPSTGPTTSSGGATTSSQPTTSTAVGVDSSSTSGANNNRSSTEDSGKENLPDSAIKVEIKQEHDLDQPTVGSGSAGQSTAGGVQQTTNPPLPAHAISKHYEEAYTLFFTNNNWYLFLRLHAILCERLRTIYERAQIIATEERMYQSSRNNSTATALRLKPKSEIKVEDFYSTFLEMLKNVLDGNMEASNFEDSLREMFGIHAYIAFTLDRVVQNAVRQLQHCVTERGALECVELFQLEQRKGGAGGLCRTANRRVAHELAYQRKAEAALQDENCFKVYLYKIDCKVTIELLDTESDDTAQNFSNAQNYSNYVDRLSNPAATGTGSESGASITGGATGSGNVEIKTEKPDDDLAYSSANRKARFLQRNLRRCKAANPSQIAEPKGDSSPTEDRDSKSPLLSGGTTTTSTTATGQKLNNVAASQQSTEGHGPNNNNNNTMKKGDGADVTASGATGVTVWNHKGKTSQAPERLPSSNGDQSYYVDDREQFRLSMNNNKISFVLNKHHIFYKRKSLLRARETHPAVTKTMHHRFDAFVQRWLDQNVSDAQRTQCNEWLLGTRLDLVKNVTVVRQNNDISRTPYMPYNRYKVEKVDHL